MANPLVWSENLTLSGSFDISNLSVNSVTTGTIDMASKGYDWAVVQVTVVFGGSPDGSVNVEFLSSSDSGSTDDTIAFANVDIEEATSATRTVSIDVQNKPFITVQATNNDSADNVDVSAIYAGRSWSV